jgi:membrane-associated phospholipid phosphatase
MKGHALKSWLGTFWRRRSTRQALMALCAVLTIAAISAAIQYDAAAMLLAEELNGRMRIAFAWLTGWGKSDWLLIPLGLAMIAFHVLPRFTKLQPASDLTRLRQRADFFFLAIAVSGVLAIMLKFGLGHPRPSVEGATGPIGFTLDSAYASFPSGHSTTMGALAAAIIFLSPRLAIPALVFTLSVAVSRVVVGAHHFSDIVAGYGLGVWTVIVIALVMARRGYGFSRGPGALPVPAPYPRAALFADLKALFGFLLATIVAVVNTRRRRRIPAGTDRP